MSTHARTKIVAGAVFTLVIGLFTFLTLGVSNAAVEGPGAARTFFSGEDARENCEKNGEALKGQGIVPDFTCEVRIGLENTSDNFSLPPLFENRRDCENAIDRDNEFCAEGFAVIQQGSNSDEPSETEDSDKSDEDSDKSDDDNDKHDDDKHDDDSSKDD